MKLKLGLSGSAQLACLWLTIPLMLMVSVLGSTSKHREYRRGVQVRRGCLAYASLRGATVT